MELKKISKATMRSQQNKFVLTNILSFTLLFVVLGTIVFQMIKTTSYKWVDNGLYHISQDTSLIEYEVNHLNDTNYPLNDLLRDHTHRNPPMQTQILIWSNEGKLLNRRSLGARYYDFATMKLNKKKLNSVYSYRLVDASGHALFFRTVTRKIKVGKKNYYVQVMTIVNQIQVTIRHFKRMLTLCMVVFWVMSLVLSLFLAKRSMRPIMRLWDKQQKFVENASHELRTPLAIIQAKLEHLFTKPQHTIIDESENIAIALNEVRRLNQLTSDLLLLARTDGNVITIHREPTDLNDYLAQIITPFEEVAAMKDRTLTYHNSVDQYVMIDSQRIHQLLVILIDNAIKYTERGGHVEVDSYIHNRQWVIEVKDDGIGIQDKDKVHLFDRFYRVDESRTRERGGYGLGLSIAKWVVDSHHGTIQILDNEPRGTIFKVVLPLMK